MRLDVISYKELLPDSCWEFEFPNEGLVRVTRKRCSRFAWYEVDSNENMDIDPDRLLIGIIPFIHEIENTKDPGIESAIFLPPPFEVGST